MFFNQTFSWRLLAVTLLIFIVLYNSVGRCDSISTSINLCFIFFVSYYKSIINYDPDIANFLVISPQIRYIEVFDLTNPRFNKQIWSVLSDFVKWRFHCISGP